MEKVQTMKPSKDPFRGHKEFVAQTKRRRVDYKRARSFAKQFLESEKPTKTVKCELKAEGQE